MNKNKKNNKGFSIFEVLISIGILTTGIIAAITLLTSSIKYSFMARDQAIAGQLAQEGLELVISVRDSNEARGVSAFTNLGDPAVDDRNNCRADYSSNFSTASCTGLANNSNDYYSLYYDTTTPADPLAYRNFYFYKHAGVNETRFTRRIMMPVTLDANRKRVISIVTWDGNYRDPAQCTLANKCVWAEVWLTTR